MKRLAVLFLLIGLYISFAQEVYRKQITFLEGADCKNFTSPDPFNPSNLFAFEADYGSKINILLCEYNETSDSFLVKLNLTDNGFKNINPSLRYLNYDTLLLLYQTNENGNWDIAYRYIYNNTVSPVHFLANSSFDETDPKFSVANYDFSHGFAVYLVHYAGASGINAKDIISSEPPQEVFHPSNNNYYYSPALREYDYYYPTKWELISSVDSSDGYSYIVRSILDNNQWGSKEVLLQKRANNISFDRIEGYSDICFDAVDSLTNKRAIYFFSITGLKKIIDDTSYSYYDLKTNWTNQIGDGPNLPMSPYIFKAERNDSVFVALSKDPMPLGHYEDTLIYTKVNSTTVGVGRLGSTSFLGEGFYSVWQDSVNGHIQLFGRKTYDPYGAVNDKVTPLDFTLYQNYPNPFNPSTSINYTLNKSAQIKLTIYSLLGEVVAVPINEYQLAGEHKVTFNAKNLSSGIYFYELSSGGVRSVRKMSLIK